MQKLSQIFLLFLCCCYGIAFAADPPPLALMKQVSSNVLRELQLNKRQLNNRRVVRNIMNRTMVPYVDLPTVARSVVGRNYWYQASPQARSEFIKQFKVYVVDMYSSAVAAYSDETITFKPMRNYNPAQARVLVYSTIQRPGAPPINLDYRLLKQDNTWKVYDFSVDGISMVQSYRAQFADTLKQGGLPQLIKKLKSRK